MSPSAPNASAPANHVLGSGIAITVKLSNWIVAVPRACQRSLKSVGATVAIAAAWSLKTSVEPTHRSQVSLAAVSDVAFGAV